MKTHHIKSMGAGSFTDKLHALAAMSPTPGNLMLNVEGPFGVGVDLAKYEHLVLVAGGIGITPCNAIFRDLQLKQAAGVMPDRLKSVTLIWVARSSALFNMFEDTLKQANVANTKMIVSLWVTKADAVESKHQSRLSSPINIGRPNLASLLVPAAASGLKSLVFHCGPTSLEKACQKAAVDHGIDFHSETFEL